MLFVCCVIADFSSYYIVRPPTLSLTPVRCASTSSPRPAEAAAAAADTAKVTSAPSAGGASKRHVSYAVRDGVAVVTFDAPDAKVNSLNEAVLDEIEPIVNEVQSNPAVRAVVLISGKTTGFIAGADIKMLEKVKTAKDGEEISKFGQDMMGRFEASSKPIVAAIMGPCLGGGLEVALGCHYRIAVDGR